VKEAALEIASVQGGPWQSNRSASTARADARAAPAHLVARASGELYALRQDASHTVELLGRVPQSGHPHPARSDLIVDAALACWEHRCGQPGSLRWARQRLAALKDEPLAPIDWSVRCLASCCPRSGTAPALADAAGGASCPGCGAPLVVAAQGGARWLARRRG
jgi:hypothetical protein